MILNRMSLLALALIMAPVLVLAADPLLVFVSVVPQQTFVERIGGDRVRVRAMVKPGESPHTFEPTPHQVAELAKADLYVRIGESFEAGWLERMRAANPTMRILDSRDGIALLSEVGDHEHEHDANGHDHAEGHTESDSGSVDEDEEAMDTHLWTSPPLVKQMGAGIRDTLTELEPESSALFAANYAQFAADLDALDAEIRARLARAKADRFMVFHPAWGYFAATYGLTQIPIESEGKEPGARALVGLIDQARREGVHAVFVQPQMSPRAAEQVARAIDGRVEVIDPLAADYFDNMRRVAGLIADAPDQ